MKTNKIRTLNHVLLATIAVVLVAGLCFLISAKFEIFSLTRLKLTGWEVKGPLAMEEIERPSLRRAIERHRSGLPLSEESETAFWKGLLETMRDGDRIYYISNFVPLSGTGGYALIRKTRLIFYQVVVQS